MYNCFNPSWVSNHMLIKYRMQLLTDSQTSMVARLTFGNRYVILYHTLLGMMIPYPCWDSSWTISITVALCYNSVRQMLFPKLQRHCTILCRTVWEISCRWLKWVSQINVISRDLSFDWCCIEWLYFKDLLAMEYNYINTNCAHMINTSAYSICSISSAKNH